MHSKMKGGTCPAAAERPDKSMCRSCQRYQDPDVARATVFGERKLKIMFTAKESAQTGKDATELSTGSPGKVCLDMRELHADCCMWQQPGNVAQTTPEVARLSVCNFVEAWHPSLFSFRRGTHVSFRKVVSIMFLSKCTDHSPDLPWLS